MKKISFFCLCLMWCFSCLADFVPGTEDIPALDDMVFSEDVTSFDVPQGQILIVTGVTQKSRKEIESFYRNNLNSLGWTPRAGNKFTRGRDVLEIEISSADSKQNVKYNLTLSNE